MKKSRRRFTPFQLWGGLLALATAVSLLLFLDRYFGRLASERTVHWLVILLEESSSTYIAALLMPITVFATRRWPPFRRQQWMRNLPLHLLIAGGLGCTALLRACGGGYVDLVGFLLREGVDPELAADSGATCLSVALTARHPAVVQLLLEHGARVDHRLPGGVTALMVASALGEARPVEWLLAHQADVRARDAQGNTALHALAQFGFGAQAASWCLPIWRSLLSAGADVNAINSLSESPLLLLLGASAEPGDVYRDEACILVQLDYLLQYGVELNTRERRGFGPLHLAAWHGLGQAVRRLLDAGADPNLRDVLNRRPAELALMRGFVDVAAEFAPERTAPSLARFLRDQKD